ncbi:TIGR02588 family protein [Gloeobacter violaceus]|uniref:Gll2151 protein n=1 Tax=Gloeobacter violaceus (strain ATCC 29082 / PCC 7421) TaxID=251221 RepID=Q7NIN2_GLOVI|nr:TIGR02588 family protein [Gloeobacter violaceus]BAC90092.1 gll2151 [Gloeobacter violaceus PCC 7421]
MNAPKRTLAEQVSFGLCVAILAGLVGLVIYDWIASDGKAAVLVAAPAGAVRSAAGQFYVPFAVENQGGQTAEAVRVEAELRSAEGSREVAEQEIDFLAGGETETGVFIFERDPRAGQLRLRVSGYKVP